MERHSEACFDVPAELLETFSNTQIVRKRNIVRELLQTSHSSVLLKFCDVCKYLNIDPLHEQALPVVVIFMCKSKHCSEMALSYLENCGCEEMLQHIVVKDAQQQNICDHMLSNMGDWLALFSFFELLEHDANNATSLKLARDIEGNDMLRRMQTSLADAQVMPAGNLPKQRISMHHTAVLAFLYMSPRKTPSGKMLEMLYTEINNTARDAELRCLRAMTAFKDTMDDEVAYTQTLPLVLRSLSVRKDFTKSVEAVLRKQILDAEGLRLDVMQHSTRPLLRTYAQNSVVKKRTRQTTLSWQSWRDALCFPPTTSSQMQLILYFISVQGTPVDRTLYESFYTKDMCDRAASNTLDSIDAIAIIRVIDSIRVYNNKIKELIDFSSKCLQGINQKARDSLSIVQVLKLYIASRQHKSIMWECWRKFMPTVNNSTVALNHTIIDNVTSFVNNTKNPYDVDSVVQNLLHSHIHDL
jgi:hypothetical protein